MHSSCSITVDKRPNIHFGVISTMAGTVNQYGLSRYISSDIKQIIRQRCGFGCVICGTAFYDYEHFDPEFKHAKEHNPEGMTLLCSQCNQDRARGRLSAYTVAKANKTPKCLRKGFSNQFFDFWDKPIEVFFAGSRFFDCKNIIVINDYPILSILPPASLGMPMRLSGLLTDGCGKEVIWIKENEFALNSDTWDIECVGPLITARSGKGDVCLRIRLQPPAAIVIERIEMLFSGVRLSGNENELRLSLDGKGWSTIANCSVESCYTGISLSNGRPAAVNDPVF